MTEDESLEHKQWKCTKFQRLIIDIDKRLQRIKAKPVSEYKKWEEERKFIKVSDLW